MALMLSTAARAESNRTEASAVHGNVEVAGAFRAEYSEGGCCSVLVIRLHQDPAHPCSRPIRLQKTRLERIIASEARRRRDADLQLVSKRHERTRPRDIRNRLPMVRTLERGERLNANLEERAIDVVEGHKADKGTKRLTGSRERPISDQIEFGLDRPVPLGVMSWLTYLILLVINSHFFNWKVTRYFIVKTEQTQSKYARRVSKDVDHKRIASMMVLLPL